MEEPENGNPAKTPDQDPLEEIKSNPDTESDECLNSGDSDSNDPDNQDGSIKNKQKRRSKNDFTGRDHKCTYCDKTYLSYPALYTHMKNKHAKGPDG